MDRDARRAEAKKHLSIARNARIVGSFSLTRAHVERALAAAPTDGAMWESAADLLLSFGARDLAAKLLSAAERVSEIGLSELIGVRLRAASIAAVQGDARAASAAAGRAIEAAPADAALRVSVGEILCEASDFAGATRRFEEALAMDPSLAAAHAGLGRLDLFRGRGADAALRAERALALDPDLARARRLLPAARLDRGDPPGPLVEAFDALLEEFSGDPELLLFRARAKERAGDPRGALKDILAAKHAGSEAQNWVADLELVALGRRHFGFLNVEGLTALGRGSDTKNAQEALRRSIHRRVVGPSLGRATRLAGRALDALPERAIAEIARALGDPAREEEGELPAPRDARLRTLARLAPSEALARLGGNRTATPSLVDPISGRLSPLPLRRSARDRAKTLQWSILSTPAEELLPRFDAIAKDHPRSHHPHAYRGELLLWLGRVDEAELDFRRGLSIRPHARWLHIGMGAVSLLRGRLDEALTCFRRSIDCAPTLVGPTLYCYRGEVHRLRGDPRAAVEDLAHTCRDTPSRISAWVNLWLAQDDLGDDEGRRKTYLELTRRAPHFIRCAAKETHGNDPRADDPQTRAVLEHALRMMRGNRSSSCVTYFTRDGDLRTVMDTPRSF